MVGNVPDMKAADTEVAVQAAYKAFQTWKKTTAKVRNNCNKSEQIRHSISEMVTRIEQKKNDLFG